MGEIDLSSIDALLRLMIAPDLSWVRRCQAAKREYLMTAQQVHDRMSPIGLADAMTFATEKGPIVVDYSQYWPKYRPVVDRALPGSEPPTTPPRRAS